MKKILYKLSFILFCISAINIAHSQTNQDFLLYVDKNFDKHLTHLNGFYSHYLIKEAPLLKASAMKNINSSALCEENNFGAFVLNMEPHLFYNPLMRTLYGSIETKVYSDKAKIIKNFITEDEIEGQLDIFPDKKVSLLFDKLTLKLENQIKNDVVINQYLKQKNTTLIEGTFCLLLN